jgi:glyceraldehyde 3-phosphate dehydrogenase
MVTRIGINGFGRIGRLVLRANEERNEGKVEVAAVNDLTDAKTNAHLFKYDTNFGVYPGEVAADGGDLIIDGRGIRVFSERDPAQIPWSEMGVDIVVESTGIFTDGEQAGGHLKGGAGKVVISAPASNVDLTMVMGVNDDSYDPQAHTIVSNASCTTNCFAPMVKVLHESFGIEHGLMSTIHSYTNDQAILDQRHSDLRRARAAAQNIIPTSTGAARAVGLVLPELNGRLHGIAFRVPTSTGSVTDFVANVGRDVSAEEVNEAFRLAAEGPLKGILEYTEDPIVSSDVRGNPHSCVFDALSTMVMQDRMVKIMGWYDNEWGYSCRTVDLCSFIAGKGL